MTSKGFGESSFSLLRRAKSGDSGALDQLVGRYLKPLRQWARGKLPPWARSGVDTEDIVQDSLVKSMRNLESFDPKRQGALQAYLRLAVKNRIRDEVRKARRNPTDILDGDFVDPATSPHDETVGADLQERYERALALLSDDERELIVARVELGYSHQQVAVAFGKPTADAARVAVKRALEKLATAMGVELD